MLRTWVEPHGNVVPLELSQFVGGNPLVSQILFSRGVISVEDARGFLSPSDYHPSAPTEIPDLQKAVDIIQGAIASKKRIGVWGDFDVDGQTSTTILYSAIKELGGEVLYHIPVRAEESHGINLPALKRFLELGVELIVTCDTGITAHEAISFAKDQNVTVVVSDHHDLPDSLPDAAAIVNPKRLPQEHSSSTLPGVGVAYKIAEELYMRAGDGQAHEQYLDLVALGIVADIALVKGDTRYLLQRGLQVLRKTTRKGLLAIMELTELNQANITEEHIAFILAPRMNAIGRLDDANSIVELLTTDDMGKARILAIELEGMNAQRKLLTDQVYQAAQAQLASDPRLLDEPVLILSHPTWPAGVIGIVASKLVEQYHRPVILLAAPPGELARGSARSIEGINITKAIAANQSLLRSFGGHPMAAGLAIEPERISKFQQAISRTVQAIGIGIQREKNLQIDGYLTLPQLSLDLVEDLERLAPFGSGNPPLVFATRDLKLTGYAAVGRSGEHIQLTIEDELGHTQPSIWWQGAGFSLPETKFDLAYSVRASTYRGQRDVQIEWIDYRICEENKLTLIEKPPLEIIDLRYETEPLTRLNIIQSHEEVIVWGEAGAKDHIKCLDRYSLFPFISLAIWTIPPGPGEIESVLGMVKPSKIFLFAVDPGMDATEAFLKRLAGLAKYRLNKYGGIASLSALAAATAQHLPTVLSGLEWLEGQGHIKIISMKGDELKLTTNEGGLQEDAKDSSSRLNSLLAESAAFRRYYLRADKDRLLTGSGNE